MQLPPLLFAKYDIFAILENQKAAMRNAIAAAPEPPAGTADDEVIGHFVKQFGIEVPRLDREHMSTSQGEVDVDVSGDIRRFISDRSRPFYIKGTRVTVHIPFTGERELFDARPSTFSLSPPRGVAGVQELLLEYEFSNDAPPPDLKGQLERDLADVEKNLKSLRDSASTLEMQLHSLASTAWQRRKIEFSTRSDVVAGLGLPRREARLSQAHPAAPNPKRTAEARLPASQPTSESPTHWHVFISHATEDKESIAKPLADALIGAGLKVWYDEYALHVGDSLRQKIEEGLAKSEYGIVILSKAFFAKHWTQQELNGLAAREVGGTKVILPVWHDVSRDDIVAASPLLADKLGIPTSLGIEEVVRSLLAAMSKLKR